MWPLDGRSSLRMVLYTLRFQHGPQVEVDLLLPGSDSLTEAQRESHMPLCNEVCIACQGPAC